MGEVGVGGREYTHHIQIIITNSNFWSYANYINSTLFLLFAIPALRFCVSTVRLKVTVPMSCCLGIVMLTHSSTCPSPSPNVYTSLSNPTTTAVNNNKQQQKMVHMIHEYNMIFMIL